MRLMEESIRCFVTAAVVFAFICSNSLAQTITSDPTPGSQVGVSWSNYTGIDEGAPLTPGGPVTSLGAYATSPTSMILKIIKRNSSTSVDVLISHPFSHPGGGWADAALSTPFVVPASGTYLAGWSSTIGTRNINPGRTRLLGLSDISGSNASVLEQVGYNCTAARATYIDPSPPRTALFISLGQSNSTNAVPLPYYQFRHGAHCRVLDINTGLISQAAEPLLGTDYTNSSWLSRFCDEMLDRPDLFPFDDLVLAPIAKSGTPVADWAAGGQYNSRITAILSQASSQGLAVTGVLYQQGERDNVLSTPRASYLVGLQSVISTFRGAGYAGPIFVAQSTYATAKTYEDVRVAQRDIVDNVSVWSGADTDVLADRTDGTHFTASTASMVARATALKVFDYFSR